MVTLEQIKLLESKIVRAIDAVTRLTDENMHLRKRNDELKELAERLKEEKTRVEAGIVSALDRLNQFEDAIERSLAASKPSPVPVQYADNPGTAAPPPPPETGGLPSAYTVNENETEPEELDNADSGEAELDIF
jgi:uncharacterized phage infection (PIP) family protein YhgE